MQALPGSVDARQHGRQAAYDAEGHFFAENAAGTQLPAAFLRLRAYFRSECVRDLCSGVTSSPKGPSRTESRLKFRFRRHFLAGGRVFAAAAYETFPPASFLRRRALLVRNPVRSPGSGVTFSPRGAFLQRMRTRPSLRRHFLSGGRPFAENAAGTHLPAPFSRQRARYRVCAPSLYSPTRAVKRRSCARMTNPAGRTFATTLAASMSGEVTQVERPRTAACSAFLTTSAGFS